MRNTNMDIALIDCMNELQQKKNEAIKFEKTRIKNWEIVNQSHELKIVEYKYVVCEIDLDRQPYPDVEGYMPFKTLTNHINAALIASAPQLFDVLKKIVSEPENIDSWLLQAKEVLLKAEFKYDLNNKT